MIFVPSISEAEYVCSILQDSATVHSKLKKKERGKIIEDFKSGKIRYIVNVGVLLVGFDYPEIDMIILARPTLSLSVYYQAIGRGVRLHEDKKDCLVVDLVGNFKRFGKIGDLIIEDGEEGWGVYSNGKLLTGVPMGMEGK